MQRKSCIRDGSEALTETSLKQRGDTFAAQLRRTFGYARSF